MNADLKAVYSLYRDTWKGTIIPREECYKEFKSDYLQEALSQGHHMMYKINDVIVVDLKTSRNTLSRADSKVLSSELNTTVIDYSNWEDIEVNVTTNGIEELDFLLKCDGDQRCSYDMHGRFKKIMADLEESNDLALIGDNLENLLKVLNVDLEEIAEPDLKKIQEVVIYDVYGKW